MNAKQRNRQYMLRNLIHFLNDNQTVWENEGLISGQIDELQNLKSKLDKAINLEEQLSMPFAGIRDDEREDFNRVFSQLAGVLHSMCLATDKKDKAYLISLTPRELMRDSLEKVVAKANNIVETAEDFKDDLEAQPTLKAVYEEAKTWLSRFQANMLLPTVRRKKRKQTLEQIEDLQNEILAFLKAHLDMNMRIFSSTQRDFFNAYLDFRSVQSKRASGDSTDDLGGGLPDTAQGDEPAVDTSGDSTDNASSGDNMEGTDSESA